MANRYFFDKRDMKYFFTKYGIMIAIAIPILLLINVAFVKWFKVTNMIWFDLLFLLVIIAIEELVYYYIRKAREKKQNDAKEK